MSAKGKILSIQQHRVARPYSVSKEREKNMIGNRIAEERAKADLSRPEFVKLLQKVGIDVVPESIRKWEHGERIPNGYQLLAICAVLGIDDVLFTFDSSYIPPLNEEGRKKVREYANDLAECGKYRVDMQPKHEIEYIDMPVNTLAVSAGTGVFLDEEMFERISVPKDSVPRGADFGIRVSGDSMEPKYYDRQIVWVQKCDSLVPGEIGVFLYDGEGYLKMYDERDPNEDEAERFMDSQGVLHKQRVLVSLNKKYDPKFVSPDAAFAIAGRVLN